METYWESGGKDPHILESTLDAGVLTASRPGKQSPVIIAKAAGRPHTRSGRCAAETNLCKPDGNHTTFLRS
jgi:hypothetical protein